MKEPSSNVVSWSEPEGWPVDATRDKLIGDWHLYQRKGGHRTSTDDLITAWYATHRRPERPQAYLDLGCGIGSVMLMVSHRAKPRQVWGIEAQPQSFAMATRSVRELPEHGCEFTLRHADFRDVEFGDQKFELITGSPPYFPIGTGVLPDDAQRRACRFEARGGVEGYLQTAARALTENGRFFLVFQTLWTDRVLEAAQDCELHLHGQADFRMRRDRPQPFLSVYEFSRVTAAEVHRFSCPVRDANGDISASYQGIRRELGL